MKARLVALLLLAGSCSDGVAPLSGDLYVLESIDGLNLPAPYHFDPAQSFPIIWDTLALGANGRGERKTLYGSFQGTKREERVQFGYTITGSDISVTLDCRDDYSCLLPPHFTGTTSSTGMTFTDSKVARVPWVYRRLTTP